MTPGGGSASPIVNNDGTAMPLNDDTPSADDSFGNQVILKSQERIREFVLSGDASVFYTSNVRLTHRDQVSDAFFVGNAGLSWNHPISPELQLQMGGHVSMFRYNGTPSLDFNSFGIGTGLAWTPQFSRGIAMFARYDVTELTTRNVDHLLLDHEFSVGMQKVVVLGRAQALSFTLGGALGITDPHSSRRDQIGGGVAYFLRLSRDLDVDLGYRWAVYLYHEGGRTDFNELVSLGLNYHFNRWTTLSAFASFSDNRSNHSEFDYDTFASGAGLRLTLQF